MKKLLIGFLIIASCGRYLGEVVFEVDRVHKIIIKRRFGKSIFDFYTLDDDGWMFQDKINITNIKMDYPETYKQIKKFFPEILTN